MGISSLNVEANSCGCFGSSVAHTMHLCDRISVEKTLQISFLEELLAEIRSIGLPKQEEDYGIQYFNFRVIFVENTQSKTLLALNNF
jgi:hypothetical protein